jgi:hypothetical protein
VLTVSRSRTLKGSDQQPLQALESFGVGQLPTATSQAGRYPEERWQDPASGYPSSVGSYRPDGGQAGPGAEVGETLPNMFNARIRGWVRYYAVFYKSALYPMPRQINRRLVKSGDPKIQATQGASPAGQPLAGPNCPAEPSAVCALAAVVWIGLDKRSRIS